MLLFDELFSLRYIREEKLFKMNYIGKDIKPYLERLSYQEIDKIGSLTLNVNKDKSKQDKIQSIISNINTFIDHFLGYLNLTHYHFLKSLINNNGEIPYENKYIGQVIFFQEHGICFQVNKNKKLMIIMPNEIRESFKWILTDIKLYIIEQNSHILKYVHGLIHLYGIVESQYLSRKIDKYMNRAVDHQLLTKLILFDSLVNLYYIIKGKYVFSYFILNHIDLYIEKRNQLTVDYYPFTDKEIIKASVPDDIKNDILLNQMILSYMKQFNYSYEKAKNILTTHLYTLKEDIHNELLSLTLITLLATDKNQLNMIINMNENIPKWSLKGYTYHQLNIKNPLKDENIINILTKSK